MSILDKIIEHKKTEIAALDAPALRRLADSSPAPRDFLAAITRRRISPLLQGEGSGVRSSPSLIAELKRASPSKGILAPHLDLFRLELVRHFAQRLQFARGFFYCLTVDR